MTTINQYNIAQTLGVKPEIDPEKEYWDRIYFLSDYILATKASGLVLGISGGQDSALAGHLAQRAVNVARTVGHEASFIAVRLPYGEQKDAADADAALAWISPDESLNVDIQWGVEGVLLGLSEGGEKLSDYHKGNVKARLRAVTQFALAGQNNMLVVGTDHAAEAVTGFFTKFGDGAADILPLSGLTKRQGRQILEYLDAPSILYTKAPTADLLDGKPGQKDEDELGLTYDQIDDYLEGKEVSSDVENKILARYLATEHKRRGPVTPEDKWWTDENVPLAVASS